MGRDGRRVNEVESTATQKTVAARIRLLSAHCFVYCRRRAWRSTTSCSACGCWSVHFGFIPDPVGERTPYFGVDSPNLQL